ncbi:MAG: tetratricopeptide repeat protein, partial [Ignavibacteria bacterium]
MPPNFNQNKDSLSSEKVSFLNLSKDVNYVGDEECYGCHSEIYNTFKKTGMGRSLYLPTTKNMIEDYEKNNQIYDSRTNFYYKMYREGENFYQMEFRLDERGKRTHELARKVDYIIGSGNNTRSYITAENGFLYEMPVTWYTEKKKWDLSPGYHKINMRFSRAISQECLNCHNSYAEHIEYTDNLFKSNIPLGIGCERCHGPGELHVKFQTERAMEKKDKSISKEIDRTIMNQKHLEPNLQMDVCFQCHLQGNIHVFKEGRKQTDFRPGMKLTDVKKVYFHDDINKGDFRVASHGARLSMSECFKKSEGKMVCTTCHNPHEPVQTLSRQFFNNKCLTCHSASALSPSSKKADHREKSDCVSCHMRQGGTSNVPHVNFTDHWIRKEIKILTEKETDSIMSSNEVVVLKDFFDENDSLLELHLGIAYVRYYESKHSHPEYLTRGIPLLERGLYNYPEHTNAMYYLGMAYMHQRKLIDAEKIFQKLVKIKPQDALTYYQLGNVLEKLSRFNDAIESFQKSISILPENYKAFLSIGNIYSNLGNTQKAIESYQQSLKILSGYVNTYNNLGDIYFHQLNDTSAARKSFEAAIKLDPDFVMALLNLGNLQFTAGND